MYKLLIAILFFCSLSKVEGQAVLQGQVRDDKETLVGVSVVLTQQKVLVRRTITDIDGNYQLMVDSGNYEVEFSYTGYKSQKIEKLAVLAGRINVHSVILTSGLDDNQTWICGAWKVPLINRDGTESGQIFTADQIRHMY